MKNVKRKINDKMSIGIHCLSLTGHLPSGKILPKHARVYRRMWNGVRGVKSYCLWIKETFLDNS